MCVVPNTSNKILEIHLSDMLVFFLCILVVFVFCFFLGGLSKSFIISMIWNIYQCYSGDKWYIIFVVCNL